MLIEEKRRKEKKEKTVLLKKQCIWSVGQVSIAEINGCLEII